MFCNSCGAQLPDGTKFCNNCGATLTPTQPSAQQPAQPFIPQQPQAPIQQVSAGYPQQPMGYPLPVTPVMIQPKKKSKAPIIIIAVIFIVIAAIIAISAIINASKTVEHGVIDGNVYTNESIGIKFTKPDAWIFADDEELVEINDRKISAGDFSDISSAVKENDVIFEMHAKSPLGTNILVQIGDISGNTGVTMDDYFDSFIEELQQSESLYADCEIGEIKESDIAGKEFSTLDISTQISFMTMQQRVCMRKHGDYMIILILTGTSSEELDSMENMFTAA